MSTMGCRQKIPTQLTCLVQPLNVSMVHLQHDISPHVPRPLSTPQLRARVALPRDLTIQNSKFALFKVHTSTARIYSSRYCFADKCQKLCLCLGKAQIPKVRLISDAFSAQFSVKISLLKLENSTNWFVRAFNLHEDG